MIEGEMLLIVIIRIYKIIIKDCVIISMNILWRRYNERNGKYVNWKIKGGRNFYLNWYVSYKIV